MPNLEYHCFRSKVKFGENAKDIHFWIDFPVIDYGPKHRLERHFYDQELPIEFIEKYGIERAYAHMIQHLDDDFIQDISERGFGYKPNMESVIKIRMNHTLNDYSKNERTYKIITIPLKGKTYNKDNHLEEYEFLKKFHTSNKSMEDKVK